MLYYDNDSGNYPVCARLCEYDGIIYLLSIGITDSVLLRRTESPSVNS